MNTRELDGQEWMNEWMNDCDGGGGDDGDGGTQNSHQTETLIVVGVVVYPLKIKANPLGPFKFSPVVFVVLITQ